MNDVKIGTIGEYRVYMSFKEIKKIANRELVRRLKLATEALKFYANPDTYERYEYDGSTGYENDGGELAEKTLKEIE